MRGAVEDLPALFVVVGVDLTARERSARMSRASEPRVVFELGRRTTATTTKAIAPQKITIIMVIQSQAQLEFQYIMLSSRRSEFSSQRRG
ncbi:MAG: hypothetical protein M3Q30_12380 [Actinomycetota bacterium]|nr:hypothetical protein [Actinomycetota bacterium]